ncbi:FAD/FMN-containing isoamyl alcohol oxidase-like protein MreA [Massarina eburnea CBS 473.64]|uniref:FAD/FMN-containing isoamyl alcohol oxidase-like protein MreA n=1 Tax=Massarina eburnea CBS 473.64 TaxID=1395130 RepID=A0A6A6S0B4_9PLEO|nr:FAD/FMN-containing isoamyl alcohol oxidase-like protein MreA [Massarina eburnea CBS 473.64]
MGRVSLLVALLSVAGFAVGADWIGETREWEGSTYQCKCYSDNSCYPTVTDWAVLNTTVGGALQRAQPPGAVCHNTLGNVSTLDEGKCAEYKAHFNDEQYITDDGIAELWPLYTNNTCIPTDNPADPCTQGFYGTYVILATTKEQIKAGVDFARERNLRLIIRNTGHDFLGRSTGYESLIINTHSFKDVKFIAKYTGPGDWTGTAAVVGAGVQGRELFRQAWNQEPKQVIVGGECPTVGWAGGYIQGGGHGPLSTIYGMGADNVLSFDAITAKGEYVTANVNENPDLFWALKGGGPASFAVVLSITVKTFPEVPTAGTILNINSTHTNDSAVFAEGFRIFHNLSNHYTANGMFVYFELSVGTLHVAPFVGPRMDEAKLNEVLKPLFDQLDAAKIPYSRHTKAFPTFFELYLDLFEDETFAVQSSSVVGGRIFTQTDIAERGDKVAEALLFANAPTESTFGLSVGHIVNPGLGVPVADNAINVKWRNSSSFTLTNIVMSGQETWAQKQEIERINTDVLGKALREAGPDGAAYVNEGDLNEPNWQYTYWGDKYPKLLETRKKWDPEGVFYAKTTPGTEDWEVIDYGRYLL